MLNADVADLRAENATLRRERDEAQATIQSMAADIQNAALVLQGQDVPVYAGHQLTNLARKVVEQRDEARAAAAGIRKAFHRSLRERDEMHAAAAAMRDCLESCRKMLRLAVRIESSPYAWMEIREENGELVGGPFSGSPLQDGPVWEFGGQPHPLVDMIDRVLIPDAGQALLEVERAARELLEVADLRGDSDLPHPVNDDKLWTARAQDAWDTLRAALEKEAR